MIQQKDLPDFGLIEGKTLYCYLPLISSSWRYTMAAINEFNIERSPQMQLQVVAADNGALLAVPALTIRALAQGAPGAAQVKLNKVLTALVNEIIEQIG